MVTFVTVLQVNLVMSILLYIMVLVYLYGVQVTSSQRDHASSQRDHASSHRENPPPQQHNADPLNSLIIQLLQADLTRGRTGSRTRTGTETGAERGAVSGTSSGQQGGSSEPHLSDLQDTLLILPYNLPPPGGDILEDDGKREQWDGEEVLVTSDLLRQHRRFHSPRVLLSDRPPLQPPPLYQTDDFVSGTLSSNRTRKRYQMEDFVSRTSSSNRTRRRRDAEHRSYRGEYSVCDSQSRWVTGRTEAVDDRGTTVTVLPKIRTNAREDIKQYFFETRCQSQRPSKGGCRGIDSKNWNSQCKTTQTFVRALTRVKNGVGWRWIRIDTSCVCALSRKRRRT